MLNYVLFIFILLDYFLLSYQLLLLMLLLLLDIINYVIFWLMPMCNCFRIIITFMIRILLSVSLTCFESFVEKRRSNSKNNRVLMNLIHFVLDLSLLLLLK